MSEELLYNQLYERTKDFGRTQFIKEIMRLERENQQLKVANEILSQELTNDKLLKQNTLTTCCGIPIEDIPKIKQQRDLYKSVIDETIDVINQMLTTGYTDFKKLKGYFGVNKNSEFGCRAEVLLEILDKANIKENE